MVRDRNTPTGGEAQTQGRPTTAEQPGSPDRDCVRAQDRHPLGAATAGYGMWQRYDLLAAPGRVAGGRCLGPTPAGPAGALAGRRPIRLVAGRAKCSERPSAKKGAATGPNPMHRGKSGTKRHLVV